MTERTQLKKLTTRIPDRFIGDNGRGMDAADHTVITQLLLQHLGAYSFEVRHILYGGAKKTPNAENITGVVCRLTATVDGEEVHIEEAGGVENTANHDGNGERLKHATSDALKRCAMRLGLGLHIWADKMYFLDRSLARSGGEGESPKTDPEAPQKSAQDGSEQTDNVSPMRGAAKGAAGSGKANKSAIDRLRWTAKQARGEDGDRKLEDHLGKTLDELTKDEVSDWTSRMEAAIEQTAKAQ